MTVDATYLIPKSEYDRVRTAGRLEPMRELALIADMCRLNALNAVKRAGSGHLGTSFSSMEMMVLLYHHVMNVCDVGPDDPSRDVFLSSKGHDVPAQYSVLHSVGMVPRDKLLKLRRLGGLEGHPNVQVRGVEANTGSLGMGISKGRGIAVAKKLRRLGGSVFVMTGDGELQEGQIWESLQTTAHQKVGVTVLVDHNKVQSDKLVSEITDLGDLAAKVTAFGWAVERCDGHDLEALNAILERFQKLGDRPRMLIADTIKGRGVSFMEHPAALKATGGTYKWHAGAPDDDAYGRAHEELLGRIREGFAAAGLGAPALDRIPVEGRRGGPVSTEFVVEAFGKRLVDLGAKHPNLVVLDGDLAVDCRTRQFELTYPDRFIQNGIAEQDMVSMAGAMARHGLLPVVNSFASFLAARANEQIYNNLTENSRVIYACHFGGLIPAGPGPSHQSIRDISLFGAFHNCVAIEPCNSEETAMALDWAVERTKQSVMLRLAIGPSPRTLVLPPGYRFEDGKGVTLRAGTDLLLLSYGPVMLHECLSAAEALADQLSVAVVNMPWLSKVDAEWLRATVEPFEFVVTVDNHSPVGGLGDTILRSLAAGGHLGDRRTFTFGAEEYPVCGAPPEVLKYHGLDAATIATRLAAIASRSGAVGVIADGHSSDADIG